MHRSQIAIAAVLILILVPSLHGATTVQVVSTPPTVRTNDFYVSNRPPLTPEPLVKLPIGAIKPEGWVRRQLELQADGFVGHLGEISQFLRKDGNAWLSPTGEGHSPWEELPYWLKGFGDMGYVLGDERIIDEAKVWIEATIASRQPDGWFGPLANKAGGRGEGEMPDLWPNMVMLNALQSYYEYTQDARVIDLMTAYFKWELAVPDERFLPPFWQQQRAGDNLASVHWLYNRTGEAFLLELGEKIHRNMARWDETVASWHNVNIAECFRAPATFYQQSHDRHHLLAAERNYAMVWGVYGEVPGGMFGGDENCRKGYHGPRQAIETCASVEFMLSCEMLLKITGDLKWADRCEDVAFNTFPPSMTADLKGLHYLTSPNACQLDHTNKAPGIQNGGEMLSYNPHSYRCCQHNVAHGWPYYAQHLWMATPDNGLAAVLYAASEVTAKVGAGDEVTIRSQTRYPFEDTIRLTIGTKKPAQFPLYLRVPGWCQEPDVKINGKRIEVHARPQSYVVLDRVWKQDDKIDLTLPMTVGLRHWPRNGDCVSVDRGPLTYSLKIGEKYTRYAGTDEWPALDVLPTTAWNYGLVIDPARPVAAQFQVREKRWPADDQPFETNAAPIEMTARARKIPNWQADPRGLIDEVQQSPVASDERTETVTLIPMGCARLRISAFPWIGDGPDATEWTLPLTEGVGKIPAKASHCNDADTVTALSDEKLPAHSNDHDIPRFTWWPRRGTTEWVQYDFKEPRAIRSMDVYWFDDSPIGGGCRIPQSWKLLYRDGDDWKDVPNPSAHGVQKDHFNTVTFDEVTVSALRIEVRLQDGFSGGILEWRVR
ncbi:MAG: glycoside hydrolase family 127 protein [Planctomycetota bacterium]|nr:glycoside hydrolase family 127 protein [Planctomycetota bacterium]